MLITFNHGVKLVKLRFKWNIRKPTFIKIFSTWSLSKIYQTLNNVGFIKMSTLKPTVWIYRVTKYDQLYGVYIFIFLVWFLCNQKTFKRQNLFLGVGPHTTLRIFKNAADRVTKFKSNEMGVKCPETCFFASMTKFNPENIVCNKFLLLLYFVGNPVLKFKTSSHLINYQQMVVNISERNNFSKFNYFGPKYNTVEKWSPKLTF